jgi:hypothetical protein
MFRMVLIAEAEAVDKGKTPAKRTVESAPPSKIKVGKYWRYLRNRLEAVVEHWYDNTQERTIEEGPSRRRFDRIKVTF